MRHFYATEANKPLNRVMPWSCVKIDLLLCVKQMYHELYVYYISYDLQQPQDIEVDIIGHQLLTRPYLFPWEKYNC